MQEVERKLQDKLNSSKKRYAPPQLIQLHDASIEGKNVSALERGRTVSGTGPAS